MDDRCHEAWREIGGFLDLSAGEAKDRVKKGSESAQVDWGDGPLALVSMVRGDSQRTGFASAIRADADAVDNELIFIMRSWRHAWQRRHARRRRCARWRAAIGYRTPGSTAAMRHELPLRVKSAESRLRRLGPQLPQLRKREVHAGRSQPRAIERKRCALA